MKKILSLLLLVLIISSCVEVKFEEAQPHGIKSLEKFPDLIQGTYVFDENDTIQVSDKDFQFLKDSTKEKIEIHKLSDVFILKKWKNTYFLNIKEENNSNWSVILLTIKKDNKVMIGNFLFDEENQDKINEIKTITSYQEFKDKDGKIDSYLINPSRKELKQIISIIPFNEIMKVKQINE